jgi:hypothetical protein
MRSIGAEERTAALQDPSSYAHLSFWNSAVNWATLSSMISSVFPYARGQQGEIDEMVDYAKIYTAFSFLEMRLDNHQIWDSPVFPRLKEIIEAKSVSSFEMKFEVD